MSRRNSKKAATTAQTTDSYQNLLTRTGVGARNLNDASTYGFNPITRNRLLLENMYRGSWVCGTAVDCVADDMTREGVEIKSDDDPADIKELEQNAQRLQLWPNLGSTSKWARLYGGAIAVMLIDGQDTKTELKPDRIQRDQLKGLLPLDRWTLQPSYNNPITELGPDLGKPKYYDLVHDSAGLSKMRIHHSRVIRMEGVELPLYQRITENGWGQSVLERLWDRLIPFDSATAGAAQLVYKAHLRTIKVDKLRDIIVSGGPAMTGLTKMIEMIRAYQSSEGITLLDKEDEFDVTQYTFSGLDNILLQFGQQISGAIGVPLVRFFGQAPAGLNSTGESDWRNYYDTVKQAQETRLRPGVERLYRVLYRSTFGRDVPKSFTIGFRPLWQMTDEQRATVTNTSTAAIVAAYEKAIIGRSTALKELKQLSHVTGAFSNITDAEIKEAEDEPVPTATELLGNETDPADDGSKAQKSNKGTGGDNKGGKSVREAA